MALGTFAARKSFVANVVTRNVHSLDLMYNIVPV